MLAIAHIGPRSPADSLLPGIQGIPPKTQKDEQPASDARSQLSRQPTWGMMRILRLGAFTAGRTTGLATHPQRSRAPTPFRTSVGMRKWSGCL